MAQHRSDQSSRIPRSVFRSPSSPARTIRSPSQEMPGANLTPTNRYSQPIGSRKRPRTDTSVAFLSTAQSTDTKPWAELDVSTYSVGAASPAPLINSRYLLNGGLDTPTKETTGQFENLLQGSEHDFRRRWNSSRVGESGRQTVVAGALERERNGGRRASGILIAGNQGSWGSFVVDTLGGFAGKVWDFCTAGAFRGFTAGGGTGYSIDAAGPRPMDGVHRQGLRGYPDRDGSTPIPGQYPTDDYGDFSAADENARSAKRQQTTRSGDWVMVNRPEPSPRLRSSSSYLGSTSASTRTAAPRTPLRTPAARRPRSSVARLSSASNMGSPQSFIDNRRTASFASPRSPGTLPQHQHQQRSPSAVTVDTDLQRFSAKKQREAKQSNDSMKRLNAQLQAMIKEGKEALAAKVEVHDTIGMDGENEDEGFVEGFSDIEATGGAKRWF